ncbi:MAG: metallophosphoesterase [Candidatus Marinamargulisbacteria bacterium]
MSYIIYVFPIHIITAWITGHLWPWPLIVGLSLSVSTLVTLCFRAKLTTPWLKALLHTGMGAGYLMSLITGLGLLLSSLYPVSPLILALGSLIMGSLLFSVAWVQGQRIHLRPVSIQHAKICRSHRFVFISDVHVGTRSNRHLHKIISRIQALSPEFVLIGGDLIDSSAITINHLDAFKRLTMPIYFVTGNHEYYLKHHATLLSQLEQVNIKWLNNNSIQHDTIHLIGISDNQSIQEQTSHVTQRMKKYPHAFSLAIIHKPHCFDAMPIPPDLMLSGHTHNGQLFPFGWLVKCQFPRIYGRYIKHNHTLYVSSGVGTWGTPLRLGSINEIVSIELNPLVNFENMRPHD